MPEKLHRCVDKVKGEKGEDSAWAICNSSIKEDINRSGKPQGAGGGGGDAEGWHRKPLIDVGHIGTTAEIQEVINHHKNSHGRERSFDDIIRG